MSRQKADTGTLYLKPVESAQHNMSGSFRCTVPYTVLQTPMSTCHRTASANYR